MRVNFVTGSLEPGRTGVGDYTRLLAAEGPGHAADCRMLALHDAFVADPTGGDEIAGGSRFPAGRGLAASIEWLKHRLAADRPDWISLQFVPYAFHKRGLVWPALKGLAKSLRGYKLQITFHEVWIGQHEGAPLKQKITGYLQREMIRRFVAASGPASVHTSIPLYQNLLRSIGVRAELLPLFSNVPVADGNADTWMLPRLGAAGGSEAGTDRTSWWLGGIFGSIHEDFDHANLLPAVIRAANELGRRPVCLWIGRPSRGEQLWNEMKNRHGREVTFVKLGEQSPKLVSQVLNSLDVGLAATPLDVIGKSGAAAAMLEHGLPVLAGNARNRHARWLPANALPAEDGVWTVAEYFTRQLHRNPPRRIRRNGLHEVAGEFYAALAAATA